MSIKIKPQEYQEFLEKTAPEERAKLEALDIHIKPAVKTINNRAKSNVEIQAIKLERLFERVDEPLELPEDKGDIYEVPFRKRHTQGPSTGQTDTDGFHHVYRLSRTKEVAKQKMLAQRAAEIVEAQEFQQEREKRKEMEDLKSAKKAEKRKKRKKNNTD